MAKGAESIVLVLSHFIAFVASEYDHLTGHWILRHRVFQTEKFFVYRREQQQHIARFTGASSGARALALLEGQQGPIVAAMRELVHAGMRVPVPMGLPAEVLCQGDGDSVSSTSSIFSAAEISPMTKRIASVIFSPLSD